MKIVTDKKVIIFWTIFLILTSIDLSLTMVNIYNHGVQIEANKIAGYIIDKFDTGGILIYQGVWSFVVLIFFGMLRSYELKKKNPYVLYIFSMVLFMQYMVIYAGHINIMVMGK